MTRFLKRLIDVAIYGLAAFLIAFLIFYFMLSVVTNRDTPEREVAVQTRLVVPQPCLDALEHGDALAQLMGAAVGAAARGQDGEPEDLTPLLREADNAYEQYKREAARCRDLKGVE